MMKKPATPTHLLLLLLVPCTLSGSILNARRSTSCPTLCIIDQQQGKFLRLVEGTYQPELHMEQCEAACTEHCLLSQDPRTPQIVTHICSPDTVLCDRRHDPSCRTHIVRSMEHRLQIRVEFAGEETEGTPARSEDSSTVFTELNFPTGLVKEMGYTTSTGTGTWGSTTAPAAHVEFEGTDSLEGYITVTRRQGHDRECSETSFECPTKQEFCFGVVMRSGEVQYNCHPDKPTCSSIEGCIRVCLPSLESCHKTVSPSSSWGTSTSSPEPEEIPELPDSTHDISELPLPTVDIPDLPDPTEESVPEEDEKVPEEMDQHVEDSTPEAEGLDLEDKEDTGDKNIENYTISNESDPELSNEWSDLESEGEEPGENETERDPNSSSVKTNCSVLLQLVLVFGAAAV